MLNGKTKDCQNVVKIYIEINDVILATVDVSLVLSYRCFSWEDIEKNGVLRRLKGFMSSNVLLKVYNCSFSLF